MSKSALVGTGTEISDKIREYSMIGKGVAKFGEDINANVAVFPSQYLDKTSMALMGKAVGFDELKTVIPGMANIAPTVTIPFTDEDLKHYETKIKLSEAAEFDKWFAQRYMSSGVAERDKMRQLHPAYFENKLKLNRDTHQLQEDMARISIKGPESFDDLLKVYALQTREGATAALTTNLTPASGTTFEYRSGLWAGEASAIGTLSTRARAITDVWYNNAAAGTEVAHTTGTYRHPPTGVAIATPGARTFTWT